MALIICRLGLQILDPEGSTVSPGNWLEQCPLDQGSLIYNPSLANSQSRFTEEMDVYQEPPICGALGTIPESCRPVQVQEQVTRKPLFTL